MGCQTRSQAKPGCHGPLPEVRTLATDGLSGEFTEEAGGRKYSTWTDITLQAYMEHETLLIQSNMT